jgi:hypothetical protein
MLNCDHFGRRELLFIKQIFFTRVPVFVINFSSK